MDTSTGNGCSASTPAVAGSAIALVHSLLANCNSIRSADKYASLMTLERYDVESRTESFIVRKLSLGRSPGVFTPLLFDCKPEFLINNSACLGSASISIRSGAFPNGGTIHRTTRFRNRTSHESRSCGHGPNFPSSVHNTDQSTVLRPSFHTLHG